MNESNIFLFSKTAYPDVHHIPILVPKYLQPAINFSSYDYIIATSKEVFTALDKIGHWKDLPVLCISESTAAFCEGVGGKVLDIADGYGKSIVSLIKEKYTDKKALHPHAKVIAFDMQAALKDIVMDSFIVYETSCSKDKKITLPSDAICIFSSPSSIKCFEKQYEFLDTYTLVCIGETTASALAKGMKYTLSKKPSIESTIECARSLQK
ncbi:uroporphyrinogen-III synthase [Sulfurimonas sp. MAG313]|nr:uroporphyrinogen-III synthase [Sulfurimonas sp. MAG313]MDF1881821.1 uroporphyrinogen-III synthase [Sulfurimonas sp. MAG313]